MRTIAALYVDAKGPYQNVEGVVPWDELADARRYFGPHPVVAHPPCTRYGRLKHLAKRNDQDCALTAVCQVRYWGGVLEHPAQSALWKLCGMPTPGEPADAYGGYTLEVDQCDWGHVARKRTWLYLIRVPRPTEFPPHREPTHWCSGYRLSSTRSKRRGNGQPVPPGIKVCSAVQRRRTPPAFAKWLIELARSVR